MPIVFKIDGTEIGDLDEILFNQRHPHLIEADLSWIKLKSAELRGCNFSGAKLSRTIYEGKIK